MAIVLAGTVAGFAIAIAPAAAQSTGSRFQGDPEQGARVAEATCAACHGKDGNSPSVPIYPKLAGQNPAYLYQQLWDFATGARPSQVMSAIAAKLSQAEGADVAAFYARQTARPDAVNDAALASAGRRIYFSGGTPGVVPACAMCHGSRGRGGMGGGMPMMGNGMMGMMGGRRADIPNLYGQHAAYTIDQLNRFASGERRGTVMNQIAAGMNDNERKAVAEFVSGLP